MSTNTRNANSEHMVNIPERRQNTSSSLKLHAPHHDQGAEKMPPTPYKESLDNNTDRDRQAPPCPQKLG
jgi:hypothetical protein